jgi:hypothetical protein
VVESRRFGDLVKQWWNLYQCCGTPCFVLAYKLKRLKLDLKCWNKKVFGNVEVRKRSFLEEIQPHDLLEEERSLAKEEIVKRALMKAELEKVIHIQEVSWRQKSRVTWLKEGDQNMIFFHCLANSHSRNNFISILSIDGSDTSNQEVINDDTII